MMSSTPKSRPSHFALRQAAYATIVVGCLLLGANALSSVAKPPANVRNFSTDSHRATWPGRVVPVLSKGPERLPLAADVSLVGATLRIKNNSQVPWYDGHLRIGGQHKRCLKNLRPSIVAPYQTVEIPLNNVDFAGKLDPSLHRQIAIHLTCRTNTGDGQWTGLLIL